MADLNTAMLEGNVARIAHHDDEITKHPARIAAVSVDSDSSTMTIPRDDISSIGITELFDIDDCPIFVIDLTSATKTVPVYHNAALRDLQLMGVKIGMTENVGLATKDQKHIAFLDWATLPSEPGGAHMASYSGLRWTAKTLRNRWRIIAGALGSRSKSFVNKDIQSDLPRLGRSQTAVASLPTRNSDPPKPTVEPQDNLDAQLAAFRLHRDESIPTFPTQIGKVALLRRDRSQDSRESDRSESLGPLDITRPNPAMVLSDHVRYFLDFDWASTELGPISSWSPELRRMVNILMLDPRPAAMYWGKQRTTIYNDAYVRVTGQKHPGMMGKLFSEAWAEVEDDFVPAFEKAYESGSAYVVDDARFYIERTGYLEECYYSISIIPFNGDNGDMAFYNPVTDTTRQVIADRRMAFLLRLGQFIAASKEPRELWQQLLRGLEADHLDLPFALLYSASGDVSETMSMSSEQSQNLRTWALEGSIRVQDSAQNIPTRVTTDLAMEDFLPNFSELVKGDLPTLLQKQDGSLPESLAVDVPIMGGKDVCECAVFLPIRTTGENIFGFLIIGLNPRKRYDDDYRLFINLLSRQLANSMASAVLFEEEIRRGRLVAEQADHDRNLLSHKLAMQTHEALEIESRFRRMADLAPVGMFHIDPSGVLIYANNDYYTLTDHPRDVSYPMSWFNVIAESDIPTMEREWAKLLDGQAVNFELRLKRAFVAEEIVSGEKMEGSTWIIAAAYPEKAEDGSVVGILGCITDISRIKWAEGFQTRKMMEAVELKRQQENFIDMTSHEMRNPLSAIIQCADWIGTSLAEFEGGQKDVTIPREAIDSYTDAAETVVLCAQHQKRIIDDILTLSKLDSDLLIITPIEVQPRVVVQNALKMFDGELQKNNIEFRFRVEPTYLDLAVDWVLLDPSRLVQVLINLTTNAIKFTQSEPTRKIVITIDASLDHPSTKNGIEYLPRSNNQKDMSCGSAWGDGEAVYLYIEVQDSGRGLDADEKRLLFKRFSQTSPRTHVQYGGSGLGLFISRELTELQGGQIGVASQAGTGSTFAFYVRARRCAPPQDPKAEHRRSVDVTAQTKLISSEALAKIQQGPITPKLGIGKIPAAPVPVKHVLIVEDNIVNQKVLSKQLRSAGLVVSVANHGGEALAFIQSSRFWAGNESTGHELCIVLMDLEMPVMDGLTCVKKIRELQNEGKIVGHVPVIAVTANARSEQIVTAKESGMDSVVTKPFRIPELIPEMDRQVRRAGRGVLEDSSRPASAPP